MSNDIPPPATTPPAPLSALQTAKQHLRRTVLTARESLSPEKRAAFSASIAHRISALPSFIEARTVLLFHPFGSEWAASLLIRQALQQGKTVVLPRVALPLGSSKAMTLHTIDSIARDTAPGMLGIREPLLERPQIDPANLEWVLVPGVAFTPHGTRLGYGAGLYDQLLPRLPAETPRIVGAFDVQIVSELPVDRHDCPVDAVHTETRVFHCARQG